MKNLKVEYRSLDELIPYANNARTHSDSQIAQIVASIAEFGFVNPVLVDGDGVLIAGHGRLMAARQLGMEKVPSIQLEHLSEAQRKALIIADNRIAMNAGCPPQSCTRCNALLWLLAVNGRHSSYGRKTHSRWGVLIISASTNQFCMAGKMGMIGIGAVRETKAMSGL